MVSVSASVNVPLHHKVQKFSSGTGSPGWSRKKGRKTVVVVVVVMAVVVAAAAAAAVSDGVLKDYTQPRRQLEDKIFMALASALKSSGLSLDLKDHWLWHWP